MRYFFLPFFLLCIGTANAQPYLDLISLRFTKSPDAGILRRDQKANQFDYYNININLPFVFKKDSSVIVLSPFAERWHLHLNDAAYLPEYLQSIALPVAYVKPISPKWTITVSLIPRWNGYGDKWFDHNFQIGGALLASYKQNRQLKYKFGIYLNNEFTGVFIMPLLGLDWKMDERNRVFGVLPGNMVWEHRAGKSVYYGAVFRAITNTYRAGLFSGKSYFVRIDDNQLCLYSDIYITKKFVFNIEAGHSVLRQLRLGYENGPGKYYQKDRVNDDFILKAALAYRIRL